MSTTTIMVNDGIITEVLTSASSAPVVSGGDRLTITDATLERLVALAGTGGQLPDPRLAGLITIADLRAHRAHLLTATDWTELPGARAGMPSGRPEAWDAYRQSLRDITENAVALDGGTDFVAWPDWPVPPAE